MDPEFTIRPMLPNDEGKLREIVGLSFSRFDGVLRIHSLLSEEGQVLVADVQGSQSALPNTSSSKSRRRVWLRSLDWRSPRFSPKRLRPCTY